MFEPAVVEIAGERHPARSGITGRTGQVALARQLVELRVEPECQLIDFGPRSSLTDGAPDIGRLAFRHAHGTDVWTYRSQHPEEGAIFDHAMTAISRGVSNAVVTAYDFAPFACVADIGGGHGALLASILGRYPAAHGILFDQAHVVSGAAELLGVADRCEIVAGSFFEAVPKGGDAYVLKGILHDWDYAATIAILRVCRGAIGSSGKLLVVERLIAPPNEAPDAKFSDLNKMVSPGGLERTREEFAAIFAAGGFQLSAVVATTTRLSVIEGVPI